MKIMRYWKAIKIMHMCFFSNFFCIVLNKKKEKRETNIAKPFPQLLFILVLSWQFHIPISILLRTVRHRSFYSPRLIRMILQTESSYNKKSFSPRSTDVYVALCCPKVIWQLQLIYRFGFNTKDACCQILRIRNKSDDRSGYFSLISKRPSGIINVQSTIKHLKVTFLVIIFTSGQHYRLSISHIRGS